MIAVITLLTGRVFDMSLRDDIILQKMRRKIAEVIQPMDTIWMDTVTVMWRTIINNNNNNEDYL